MTKDELVRIIEKLLRPDTDLEFLLKLRVEDLTVLTGCIRERVEKVATNQSLAQWTRQDLATLTLPGEQILRMRFGIDVKPNLCDDEQIVPTAGHFEYQEIWLR